MAKCTFCGEEAGFLKSKHKTCETSAKTSSVSIETSFQNFEIDTAEPSSLVAEIARFRVDGKVPDQDFRRLIDAGIKSVTERFLDDGIISAKEESVFMELLTEWDGVISPIAKNSVVQKMVKAITLGDLANGVVPTRFDFEGMPIILRKNEVIVWGFSNVKYYIYKKNRQFVSGNRGVSVRVAKGVYFRAGASRGRAIVTDDLVHDDTGDFAISNQALHFKGNHASFRLPFDKLQSVNPISDSIEVSDTRQNSKPVYFGVDDTVFAANVIMNLINFDPI
jgi:hypothetical protein